MKKIKLGIVAFDEHGVPYVGGQYTAGAKVYKSEKMARSALRGKTGRDGITKINFTFAPAYAEIEDHDDATTISIT